MSEAQFLINNQVEFLKYLKNKFHLVHLSNIFFRDFHYGVMSFLQDRRKKMKYLEAENIAREVVGAFESQGLFKKIDQQSWLLNYPEFALPRIEKKAS